jgi:hypothetical protein
MAAAAASCKHLIVLGEHTWERVGANVTSCTAAALLPGAKPAGWVPGCCCAELAVWCPPPPVDGLLVCVMLAGLLVCCWLIVGWAAAELLLAGLHAGLLPMCLL